VELLFLYKFLSIKFKQKTPSFPYISKKKKKKRGIQAKNIDENKRKKELN
jgi:hypothetical protein